MDTEGKKIATANQLYWIRLSAERALGCSVSVRQIKSSPDIIQIRIK